MITIDHLSKVIWAVVGGDPRDHRFECVLNGLYIKGGHSNYLAKVGAVFNRLESFIPAIGGREGHDAFIQYILSHAAEGMHTGYKG